MVLTAAAAAAAAAEEEEEVVAEQTSYSQHSLFAEDNPGYSHTRTVVGT